MMKYRVSQKIMIHSDTIQDCGLDELFDINGFKEEPAPAEEDVPDFLSELLSVKEYIMAYKITAGLSVFYVTPSVYEAGVSGGVIEPIADEAETDCFILSPLGYGENYITICERLRDSLRVSTLPYLTEALEKTGRGPKKAAVEVYTTHNWWAGGRQKERPDLKYHHKVVVDLANRKLLKNTVKDARGNWDAAFFLTLSYEEFVAELAKLIDHEFMNCENLYEESGKLDFFRMDYPHEYEEKFKFILETEEQAFDAREGKNMGYMDFDRILTMIAPKIMKKESHMTEKPPYYLPNYQEIGEKVEYLKHHACRISDDTVVFVESHCEMDRFPCYPFLILEECPFFEDEEVDGEEISRYKDSSWSLKGFKSMPEAIEYVENTEFEVSVFFRFNATYEEARPAYCAVRPDGCVREVDAIEFRFMERYAAYERVTKFVKLEGVCQLCAEGGEVITLPCHSINELISRISGYLLVDIMAPDEDNVQEGLALFEGRSYPFTIRSIDGRGTVDLYNEDGERFDVGVLQFLPFGNDPECERGHDESCGEVLP